MKRGRRKRHTFRNLIIVLIIFFGIPMWLRRAASDPSFQGSDIAKDVIGITSGVPQPENPETVSADKYAYSTLDDETKVVYDQVYDTIINQKEDVPVSTLDKEILSKAFHAVYADYPGLFWASGYSYNTYSSLGVDTDMTFTPTYTMSREDREAMQVQIDQVADTWLSEVSSDVSDYDKSKFVFDKVVANTEYDLNSENNQNIISVFINGRSVCQGYADATAYLLQKLGVQCTVVTGEIPSQGPHAWNLVLLDGQYYYIDATWGDGSFLTAGGAGAEAQESSAGTSSQINYLYLNATTEDISRTHTFDDTLTLPECTATEDNYFRKMGRFFDTFDGQTVGLAIAQANKAGEDFVALRFADEYNYQLAMNFLFTQQHFYDYVRRTSVSYIEDPKNCILTILLD